jgi:proteic killer suppression protein
MDITFSTKKIQKVFNSEKELIRAQGAGIARIIMRRMVVLRAAETLNNVSRFPPERCHELTGEMKGIFAVDLKHPYRLLFEPVDPIPYKEDGGIDLLKVTAVSIIGIKDYH